MSKSNIFLIFLLFLGVSSYSQSVNHTVSKGENVYRISLKYGVSIQDIYSANPGSETVIKPGQILIIPKPNSGSTQSTSGTSYVVKKGETKYGLSKRFGLTIQELESRNPQITNGLLEGHVLNVPENSTPAPQQPVIAPGPNTHTIKKGETMWNISQSYGLKVQPVIDANPGIDINDLQIGQVIRIPENGSLNTENSIASSETGSEDDEVEDEKGNITYQDYTIKPKETLYGLSKRAGMTMDEFVVLNPQLKNGVTKGTVIKMPKGTTIENSESEIITEVATLEPSIEDSPSLLADIDKSQTKEVVWLIPQSLSNLSNFKNNSAKAYFEGGHLAINDLKSQGFSIEETIVDVSSKTRKELNRSISDADLVILSGEMEGISNNLELKSDATLLNLSSQPLSSKRLNLNPIANFSKQAKAILDFADAKNANIIVINDSRRSRDKAIIENLAPQAGFVKVKSNDSFKESDLTDLLVASRLNFVIINSDKTSVFLNATNSLLRQYARNDVQLAVLNASLIPNNDQISDKRFRILNLMFPSMIDLEKITQESGFQKQYKSEYNNNPSSYACIGYDASLDALMRIFNRSGAEATLTKSYSDLNYLQLEYESSNNNSVFNENILLFKYHSDSGFEKLK
ncbi:LysM peptidoglycan-binding domain-containing protein [Winogradskyella aurantiaca]|uniref:LysM peptidoglycan-binding domain-containing protein n=1 Tax=Winogradskyella aurantiaca TaxID=2219558 RepID=UPI000E1D94F0|nr:LysM peptidoglycan-binding domain-containing protein [Winogradskyella aurantiaca]